VFITSVYCAFSLFCCVFLTITCIVNFVLLWHNISRPWALSEIPEILNVKYSEIFDMSPVFLQLS